MAKKTESKTGTETVKKRAIVPKTSYTIRKEFELKKGSTQSSILYWFGENGEPMNEVAKVFTKIKEDTELTEDQLKLILLCVKDNHLSPAGVISKIKNKKYELVAIPTDKKTPIKFDIPHVNDDRIHDLYVKFVNKIKSMDIQKDDSVFKNVFNKLYFHNVYFKPGGNIDSCILKMIEIYCYYYGIFTFNGEIFIWDVTTNLYQEKLEDILQHFNIFWFEFIMETDYCENDKELNEKMKKRAFDIYNKVVTDFTNKLTLKKKIRDTLLRSNLLKMSCDVLNRDEHVFPINGNSVITFEIDTSTMKYVYNCYARNETHMFTKVCDVNYDYLGHMEYKDSHPDEIWSKHAKTNTGREKMRKFISDFSYDEDPVKHARKIKLLKYMLGSSILGETDKIYFFLGKSAGNGKSTLLKILEDTIGENFSRSYLTSIICHLDKNGENASSKLASLYNLRAAFIGDTGENFQLCEEIIKRLTGEDKIDARLLYENSFAFKSIATFYLLSNHSLDLSKWSPEKIYAIKRRILYFICNSKFRKSDNVINREDFKTEEEFNMKLFENENNVDSRNPYYFPCDSRFTKNLDQESKDAFFEIIMEGAVLYLNNDVETESENLITVQESNTTISENKEDMLKYFLDDTYTITRSENDKVTIKDMINSLRSYVVINNQYNWGSLGIKIDNRNVVEIPNGNGKMTEKIINKFRCIDVNVKYDNRNRKQCFYGIRNSTIEEMNEKKTKFV